MTETAALLSQSPQFLHVGGQSINMSLVRFLWIGADKVMIREQGQVDLELSGLDRDLVAEAVGLPSPEELADIKAGAKVRLAAAQKKQRDAGVAARKVEADKAKAAEAKPPVVPVPGLVTPAPVK